jgi:hypothetical protein
VIGELQKLDLEFRNADSLGADLRFFDLWRGQNCGNQVLAKFGGKRLEKTRCEVAMLIGSQTETQAELGVVLEQRNLPGGAAALVVFTPRRNGKIAAVNR